MKPKLPSNKHLLDELVGAIQDVDSYYGRTGRNDHEMRRLEKVYKKARNTVRLRMLTTSAG